MTPNPSLLLCALGFAWSVQAFDSGVYGLGYWNESYATAANANPNTTNSVPFSIGTGNYTFQVNISDFTTRVAVVENRTETRHYIASFYNLLWEGGNSLNQSLRDAVAAGTAGEGIPRLCLTVHTGTLPQDVTNAYKEQDEGDCSNAFGKQCMDDLKKITGSQASNCRQSYMPESCKSRFGNGSYASATLIDPSRRNNETDPLLQNSPVEFSFYQKQVLSAEDETYYDREDKRLHVVFFSGQWGVTPVCNRVNGSKVSKGDMAVSQEGTAAGLGVNTGLLLVMTVLAVMVML